MQTYDRQRWLKHIFRLRGSTILAMYPHILFTLSCAAVIVWAFEFGYIITAPLAIHGLVGTVLGLVLAFRTNTGYDRFWEGRKAWGAIVNRTRNLARMISTAVGIKPARQHRMGALVVAYAWACRRDLGHIESHADLDRLLGVEVGNQLVASPGPPQRVLQSLSKEFEALRGDEVLDSNDHARFEVDLAVLIDSLGVCHRIQKTPIPFAYAVFLRRFLLLYTVTLAIPLAPLLHWWSIPVVGFVSYALFGLEQIGVEIENPFEEGPNDLDLKGICVTIENDVMGHFDPAPATGSTSDG